MLCILVRQDYGELNPWGVNIVCLTLESCKMEINADINGSIKSRDGVIDVIMASNLPDTRWRSRLSFKSRSSKIAGLDGSAKPVL